MKLLFFPFIIIGKLIELIIKMTGRLVAVVMGLVLMIVGVLLSATIAGAFIGVPLAIMGFTMMIRGFF